MPLSSIKEFRRRMGWTQWELAEHLGVDQGTVSRWERGVENPRPVTDAKIRDLILRADDQQAIRLFRARLDCSLTPTCFMDAKSRLVSFNGPGEQKYRNDFNLDVNKHIGLEFAQHAEILDQELSWEVFKKSRILSGELLLVRFYFNTNGVGHVTQYDPVFELGKLAAIGATVVGTFQFPGGKGITLERAEAVTVDKPGKVTELFRGPMASYAKYP